MYLSEHGVKEPPKRGCRTQLKFSHGDRDAKVPELMALACPETFLALILILHTCETYKPTSEYDKLAKLAGTLHLLIGDAKLHIRGLSDITVRPWQEDTLDSDEEVEYLVGRRC